MKKLNALGPALGTGALSTRENKNWRENKHLTEKKHESKTFK